MPKNKSAAKKYLLKFREVNRNIFEAIRDGRKKIETRAATEKYRGIKTGDVVILACGKDKLEKRVKYAQIFKTIAALLRKYKISDVAPHLSSTQKVKMMYDNFPGYREKIKKHGLIAIKL